MRNLLLAVAMVALASVDTRADGKSVAVKGYYRKDGTYVQPHMRSAPGQGTASGVIVPRVAPPPATPRTESRTTARGMESAKQVQPDSGPREATRSSLPSVHTVKGVTVEVRGARVGKPRFVNATRSKFYPKPVLVIELAVSLTGDTSSAKFRTFAGPKVRLTTSSGKVFRHIETDDGMWPDGRYADERDVTKGKHADPLVFEPPDVWDGDLTLEVFWDYAGSEPIVLNVPSSQISR